MCTTRPTRARIARTVPRLLIERNWHELRTYRLQGNRCGRCQHVIAGHFAAEPGDWGRRRLPIDISRFARQDACILDSRNSHVRRCCHVFRQKSGYDGFITRHAIQCLDT